MAAPRSRATTPRCSSPCARAWPSRVHNASVLLLTHPSLEGIRSGSGLSGSTAWHNSVRARCVFNFSETGWQRRRARSIGPACAGVAEKQLRPTARDRHAALEGRRVGGRGRRADTLEQQLRWRNIDAMFSTAARTQSTSSDLSPTSRASTMRRPNLPTASRCETPSRASARNELENAMDRLFDSRRIMRNSRDPPSRQRPASSRRCNVV